MGVALFGALDLDLTSAPPELEVTIVAIFGGVTVRVRPDEKVVLDGLSLFGGRNIEPRQQSAATAPGSVAHDDDDAPLPIEIDAYCVFGGISVKRAQSWKQSFS